jgi:hypothetical protein
MLEIVREYASAKLVASGEHGAVLERLYQHLVTMLETIAPKLSSADQAAAFLRLDGDVENIFTAIGWAMTTGRSFLDMLYAISVSTWLFWIVRGQFRRFPSNIVQLVRRSTIAGRLTHTDWTIVRFAGAGPAFSSGRFEDVVDLLTNQARIAEAAGRTTQAALMLMALAASRPYEPGGRARGEFEHALALVAQGEEMNRGYVLVHMGSLLLADGDVDGARSAQQQSLAIAEALGDPNLRAESHFQLAHDAVAAGEIEHARAYAASAADHYIRVDHLEGKSFTLGALAGIAVSSGDATLAARLLGAAAGLRDAINLRAWPLVGEIERRYGDRARDVLGSVAFLEAFESGRNLRPDEAVELGLGSAAPARR